MIIKYFFNDTETTGTNFRIHGIVQLAGMIVYEENGKFETKERFNFEVAPFPQDVIEDEALQISGRTRGEVELYRNPIEVHADLMDILARHCDKYNKQDKLFFIGYNAPFDSDFIRKWFEKCNDKYFGSWFWSPAIDVMSKAADQLKPIRHTLPNFKLQTVADYLGISAEGDYHDALKDIEVTKQMYIRLTQGVVEVQEEKL
ncbi:MAG: exonuclease domain-containing protein [Bacillota bacterium]